MFEWFKKNAVWFDVASLIVGFVALICGICLTDENNCKLGYAFLSGAASIACLAYIIYAVILWFLKRPKFDWHLINGHFLCKVCCLVLLTPSMLAVVTIHFVNSPKQLAFDEGLYSTSECKQETISGHISHARDSLLAGASINLYRKYDEKLPESITKNQKDPSRYWSVYYHFIDPGNQHMTTTKRGRVFAALISILGVFLLNGLLVSSIIGYIDRRKEKWMKGDVRYNWFLRFRRHYVIIGGNDMVVGIVKQILTKIFEDRNLWSGLMNPYVLIQTSRDVEEFRRELFSELTVEEQKRVIIYYGNRTSKKDIAELLLENATEVYVLGEDTRTDDIESYHDTMNMECLRLISDNIANVENFNKNNKLVCRVLFEYQTSFNILQVTDIDGEKINFKPFNYYETWAQNVLICKELDDVKECKYLPLEGFEGIKAGQDEFVHFIVVGMSRMGLAMAIEAAHLSHFPNFETNKKRTRITFIDTLMEKEKHFFMGRFKEMFSVTRHRDIVSPADNMYGDVIRFPWNDPLKDAELESPYCGDYLGNDFIDIEWEFINGSVENPYIQQYLSDAAACKDAKLTIAVCLPENSSAIATATYLPNSVYDSESTLQILVYQRLNDDLLCQISQNKRFHDKLKAFGMNSLCYNFDLVELSEFIAERVGDAYNQYAWEKRLARYMGKGLIEDDYDSLSDYLYSDKKVGEEDKKIIKGKCKEWMKSNSLQRNYKDVQDELKMFQGDLKRNVSKSEVPSGESNGKSKSAKMWSNQYNVYSMWTKCRSVGINPNVDDFKESMLNTLGKMEHNRWIVEQLLLRYRPLSSEQQKKAQITDLYSSAKQKNIYKKDFAHLDICSNEKLAVVDYNISELDQELIRVLPSAYREYLASKVKQ